MLWLLKGVLMDIKAILVITFVRGHTFGIMS